jgi:lysophospholipase L1-like esterase
MTVSMIARVLQRACLVLTPLALGVVAAEFYAASTEAGNAALFVEDPELYVVREPGTDGYTFGNGRWIPVHINRQGLRGDELPEVRDPEEDWILCVGDSFTFGGGVETHEAWPQQLQSLLGAPASSKVRVLNGGANGWDTAWQRLYLERRGLAQLQPRIVVLGFNWNDLDVDTNAPQQAISLFIRCEHIPQLAPFARFPALRSTHLYRMLYCKVMGTETVPSDETIQAWSREYREKREAQVIRHEKSLEEVKKRRREAGTLDDAFWIATDTPSWKTVRAELTRMRDLCAAAGVKLLVAQMPEPSWDGPAIRFPGSDRLDAMLASIGVPTVDLQPDFLVFDDASKSVARRPGMWLRYDPTHPSPEGQRLLADGIAKKLRELGWVK